MSSKYVREMAREDVLHRHLVSSPPTASLDGSSPAPVVGLLISESPFTILRVVSFRVPCSALCVM